FQERILNLYHQYHGGVLHKLPPHHNLSRIRRPRADRWLTDGGRAFDALLGYCRIAMLNKVLTVPALVNGALTACGNPHARFIAFPQTPRLESRTFARTRIVDGYRRRGHNPALSLAGPPNRRRGPCRSGDNVENPPCVDPCQPEPDPPKPACKRGFRGGLRGCRHRRTHTRGSLQA